RRGLRPGDVPGSAGAHAGRSQHRPSQAASDRGYDGRLRAVPPRRDEGGGAGRRPQPVRQDLPVELPVDLQRYALRRAEDLDRAPQGLVLTLARPEGRKVRRLKVERPDRLLTFDPSRLLAVWPSDLAPASATGS